MTGHKQVWVKVNAPVDVDVKDLVTGLNAFPMLETVESCQGAPGEAAWICFRYGAYWNHPWRELAEFVLGYLAPGLASLVADDVNVRIQVTASGLIFGELSVRPGAKSRVSRAVRTLAKRFNASRRRSSVCFDDTFDTSPSRC